MQMVLLYVTYEEQNETAVKEGVIYAKVHDLDQLARSSGCTVTRRRHGLSHHSRDGKHTKYM